MHGPSKSIHALYSAQYYPRTCIIHIHIMSWLQGACGQSYMYIYYISPEREGCMA